VQAAAATVRSVQAIPLPEETAVPLQTRSARLTRLATATAATCVIAGGTAIIVADDSHAASPPGPAYADLQANKARSMHALGLHLAAQRAKPASRTGDLEHNKARSQGARR
jgi:hypothetical protein